MKGQSVVASRAIAAATVNGSWVLLQNCHLGLDYMETMEDYLQVRWRQSVFSAKTRSVADNISLWNGAGLSVAEIDSFLPRKLFYTTLLFIRLAYCLLDRNQWALLCFHPGDHDLRNADYILCRCFLLPTHHIFCFPDASSMPLRFPAFHHERAASKVPHRPPSDEHQGHQRAAQRTASRLAAVIHSDCRPGEKNETYIYPLPCTSRHVPVVVRTTAT